jgi:hypothetical protein
MLGDRHTYMCSSHYSFVVFYFILFYFILLYCILFHFILFYFILFYFILFYFILFCFILFYFTLLYFTLFCFILFSSTLFYFNLLYFILLYFILFYFILFYFILCTERLTTFGSTVVSNPDGAPPSFSAREILWAHVHCYTGLRSLTARPPLALSGFWLFINSILRITAAAVRETIQDVRMCLCMGPLTAFYKFPLEGGFA